MAARVTSVEVRAVRRVEMWRREKTMRLFRFGEYVNFLSLTVEGKECGRELTGIGR